MTASDALLSRLTFCAESAFVVDMLRQEELQHVKVELENARVNVNEMERYKEEMDAYCNTLEAQLVRSS